MCALEGLLPTKGTLRDHPNLPQDSLSSRPIGQLDTDSNRTQNITETEGLGAGSPSILPVHD